jgi:serine phosphatase RsbU (regulator of sigma subunit)
VSELRGALASTQSPAKALEKFNKTLAGQRRSSLMVNVSVMILDRKNKSLTYAGAGNSKVYMVDAESQSIDLLENCSASPVGIISDWNFSENKYEFSEESILFAHTDGLVRCVNENGEPVNQLMIDACMLESLKGGTPAAKIMLECLHDYSETPLFMDDITMISLAMKK